MKKTGMIFLMLLLAMTLMVACGSDEEVNGNGAENEQQEADQEGTDQEGADQEGTDQEKEPTEEEQTETENEGEAFEVKVAAPAGAPTLSMIRMFKEDPSFGERAEVEYESVQSPDLMASRILSGEVDIAIVPTNLAASLYQRGADFQLAASSVWGILYMLGNEEISDWEDLKGRDIHTLGRGLTPDIILRHVLSANGIDPDEDVNLHYMGGATELAPAFISGQIELAVIPEPAVSKVLMNREDARVLYDLQEEWSKSTEGEDAYPQASLIIHKDLIENESAFVEAFLAEYESSIDWLFEDRETAGEYSEELGIGMKKGAVVQGLDRMNIDYQSASEARDAVETYFEVLLEASPKTVGGQAPDDGFYFDN